MHHPWRAFRALTHVRLRWAHLPEGFLGYTDHAAATVTLTHGMTQVERRCTIAHETEHITRGPVVGHLTAREERAVDQAAACRLVTFEELADAMIWAGDEHELADVLWVDVPTVVARLEALTPAESDQLAQRVIDAELHHP